MGSQMIRFSGFGANEILPGIFLGSAHDAMNVDALRKYHIKYILNVADDVPTPDFINNSNFVYKRLDVKDHGHDIGISRVFPEAIQFYNMANTNRDGNMLIHCKHGVNRSATITVLLVNQITGMNLRDSYNLAASKRRIHILPDNQRELTKYLYYSRNP
jgi:protein-tyrosine phosphatase